ncbi:hypothetical protein [Candidatus Sororendozoicomonas aggregata]|uniref:hypothetical protein n=1 Tax=Candidatus Sororendozoicomonas aggregata TaxID=3073239 RepID=UPI002ED2D9AA
MSVANGMWTAEMIEKACHCRDFQRAFNAPLLWRSDCLPDGRVRKGHYKSYRLKKIKKD